MSNSLLPTLPPLVAVIAYSALGKTRERRSNTDSSVIPYDPSRESIGPGLRAPSTDIFKVLVMISSVMCLAIMCDTELSMCDHVTLGIWV